jgi:tRNA N6-adenosine threonylcarbamoyltransferase
MVILGIETSCDETAAAVVADGSRILSSVVASQVDIHHRYGGVVPELASRKHLEAIVPVVQQALDEAGFRLDGLDAVAATQGPGLVGALLVGFSFAKALAYALRIPLLAMDHLEGHLFSVLLSPDPPFFPFVALLASGGHTGIYYLRARGDYQLLGQTRDDAAGEAYDKVAKMLGLGYPGGAVIDRLALRGDPQNIVFTRPYLDKERFDFSFSGLKTAVHRQIAGKSTQWLARHQADIAAGFQAAVVDVLAHKLFYAAQVKKCRHVAVVGGVAANQGLRERLSREAHARNIRLHVPPLTLCGDNAAMIAAAACHFFGKHRNASLQDDVYSRHRRVPTESDPVQE